jgi:hypothetical protein
MKNKKASQIEIYKSIRLQWEFNPATKQIPSKKIYNRKKMGKAIIDD